MPSIPTKKKIIYVLCVSTAQLCQSNLQAELAIEDF